MPIEKILQKIRHQLSELMPSLELFLDDSVQPTTADCERLQKLLTEVQEQLAVYKFHKAGKEISPSFNLHSHISLKEEATADAASDLKSSHLPDPKKAKSIEEPTVIKERPIESRHILKPFTVGINDKFRFINELFSQNNSEYNIAMEQINNLNNWSDAELYLASLKNVYGWKDHNESVKYFYSLVKRRFE
jgi:hypothetical protein